MLLNQEIVCDEMEQRIDKFPEYDEYIFQRYEHLKLGGEGISKRLMRKSLSIVVELKMILECKSHMKQ
jgi:hypothetical protein